MLNKFFQTDKVMTSLIREAAALKVEAAKLQRDSYSFRCLADQFKLRPSFQNPVKYKCIEGTWICSYDDGSEESYSDFGLEEEILQAQGRSPEEASVHFDLVWFGIEQHYTDGG